MKRLMYGVVVVLSLCGLSPARERAAGEQPPPARATTAPEIPFDSIPDFLKLPDGMNFGEVPGVAVNSKGHVFVFTRSNSAYGPAYGPTAAQLLEFGPKGEFIREVGKQLYAWSFAHSVRIDKDDNIWAIDKGSDMVIKFTAAGRVQWVFGRRQESADGARPWEHVDPPLPARDGLFRQPTDVAWDSKGNIYITDGYVDSRVAKYDRNGDWVKQWGTKGRGPGQFDTPHSIAIDRSDNVYVGDRGNRRVQVFDTDGTFLRQWTVDVAPDFNTRSVNGPTPRAGSMQGVGARGPGGFVGRTRSGGSRGPGGFVGRTRPGGSRRPAGLSVEQGLAGRAGRAGLSVEQGLAGRAGRAGLSGEQGLAGRAGRAG